MVEAVALMVVVVVTTCAFGADKDGGLALGVHKEHHTCVRINIDR